MLFFLSIAILIIGLVSLGSPDARGFSIPMIIVGGVSTLAFAIYFLISYLKARNIKKFFYGNYYVIETTNEKQSYKYPQSYKYLLSKKNFKENDYVVFQTRNLLNRNLLDKIVLKVKKCEKLYYKNKNDNNFPVDRLYWEQREIEIIGTFDPSPFVFCSIRFPSEMMFKGSADIKARIPKRHMSSKENTNFRSSVKYFNYFSKKYEY